LSRSRLVVTVLVGLSSAACDGTDHVGRSEHAIINGTPAPDDVAVVGLAQRVPICGGNPTAIECTATLVAPRVVVTAAHCLGSNPPNVFQVFFGASFDDGGVLIPVVGGRAHPSWDAATHANDIAVLVLESDAPSTITPIPMRTAALPGLTGSPVRMVGFGVTDVDANTTGVRRSGIGRVTAVGADDVTMAPDPGMSCSGDSGGPVLADLGGGEELIGVTSHGDAACAERGVAIRVDRHVSTFIQAIIDEAAAPPARRAFDPDEPLCATTCQADADCPAETVCFGIDDQPRHCVYRGLPAGNFGAPCTPDDDCELTCVEMPDGSCRRHIQCESVDSGVCEPPDGCCRVGRPIDSVLGALVGLALVLVRRRRRA
jgi:hypothetical protein